MKASKSEPRSRLRHQRCESQKRATFELRNVPAVGAIITSVDSLFSQLRSSTRVLGTSTVRQKNVGKNSPRSILLIQQHRSSFKPCVQVLLRVSNSQQNHLGR